MNLRAFLKHQFESLQAGRLRQGPATWLSVSYFNLSILAALLSLLIGVPFVFKQKLGATLLSLGFLFAALAARRMARSGLPQKAMNCYAPLVLLLSVALLVTSQRAGVTGLIVCSFVPVYGAVAGFARALLLVAVYLGLAVAYIIALQLGLPMPNYFPGGPLRDVIISLFTLPLALLPFPVLFRQLNESQARSEREIDERKAAEAALQQTAERLADFSSSASDWFWETDAQFRFTFLSRSITASISDAPDAEYRYLGRTPWENTLSDDPQSQVLWRAHQARLAARQPFRDFEYPVRTQNGEVRWISTSGKPLFSGTGEFLGYRGNGIDITERMQIELGLLEARDAAESANRAKSQFLANLSHEIKTPLNGILGMTSLLQMSELAAEQTELLGQLKESALSMQAMLNRILDFANLEAGAIRIRIEPMSLREICEIAIESHLPEANRKGLALALQFGDGLPDIVAGDATRLLQALDNLLDNAIKFTERGQIIVEIALAEEPALLHQARVRFTVRDTGCGIAPEKMDGIFEAFSQADGSITRKAGGNGIGLAICRSVVKLMKGNITLESVLNQGSAFHITLPFEVMAQ